MLLSSKGSFKLSGSEVVIMGKGWCLGNVSAISFDKKMYKKKKVSRDVILTDYVSWDTFLPNTFSAGRRNTSVAYIINMLTSRRRFGNLLFESTKSFDSVLLYNQWPSLDDDACSIGSNAAQQEAAKFNMPELIRSGISDYAGFTLGPYLKYARANKRVRKFTKGNISSYLNLVLVSDYQKFGILYRLNKTRILEHLSQEEFMEMQSISYKKSVNALALSEIIDFSIDGTCQIDKVQHAMVVTYLKEKGGLNVLS